MAGTPAGPKYAFFKGSIVPIEQATVSVMTTALHYGTAVFAGMRAYWNEDEQQLFIFRSLDHFERLVQSAMLLRIRLQHTPQELTDILQQLLQQENYQTTCYIRPLAYKSSEMMGMSLHELEDALTIFAMPASFTSNDTGLHVCFSAWRRVDDNAIPARGKVSGAYANSALIRTDAILSGYDDALVLTQSGHVSEASIANMMMVRKGKLITPPVTEDILEGVTRRTIIELAREELGIEVVERPIDRTEIYVADEVFLCGTGMQFAPVTRVEHRAIGTGSMGIISRQLRDLYFDVVTGRMAKYRHWLTPVYEKVRV